MRKLLSAMAALALMTLIGVRFAQAAWAGKRSPDPA